MIAEKCQDLNKKKVIENIQEDAGKEGNLKHQGIWQIKRKLFPKGKQAIPVGKKNIKNQLVTNPDELKKLESYKF